MTRDELYGLLRENNIYSRKYFFPLTSDQVCFGCKYKKAHLVHAGYLADRVLTIPFYAELEEKKMKEIVSLLEYEL
jgi:dTDP-4-amino-4,6-dideoxygalactose transaminase